MTTVKQNEKIMITLNLGVSHQMVTKVRSYIYFQFFNLSTEVMYFSL